MKNFNLVCSCLALLSFTLFAPTIQAQSMPPDTNNLHHDLIKNVATVFSFEDTDWDESTTIPLWLKSAQDLEFNGHFKIADNPWFQINGSDSVVMDTTLSEVYQRTDTAATVYDTATVIVFRKEVLFYPEESPYAFEACGMGILHSTKLYGDSIQGMSNAMFDENSVRTSGFISGTGDFFRWPIWYDDISVKVIETLPYYYQDKLLPNCVHTKRGDDEFWLVRDIGVVKYKWLNGHVWELINHKIK